MLRKRLISLDYEINMYSDEPALDVREVIKLGLFKQSFFVFFGSFLGRLSGEHLVYVF